MRTGLALSGLALAAVVAVAGAKMIAREDIPLDDDEVREAHAIELQERGNKAWAADFHARIADRHKSQMPTGYEWVMNKSLTHILKATPKPAATPTRKP